MNRRSLLGGLGIAGVTAITTHLLSRSRKKRPKGIYLQMGTSITAGFHGPGSNLSPYIVGERLNLVPINAGFDGSSATPCGCKYLDDFSLERLVVAIHSHDWSAQDSSIQFLDPINKLSLSNLKGLSFENITYIGLEYSVNDFTICVPLKSFGESLRKAVLMLLSDFPKLHIFTIGPAWSPEGDSPNKLGYRLSAYANILSQVSSEIGIPYLDMMRRMPLTAENDLVFTFDGKHPNETGARVRGEITASFMKEAFQPLN